MSLLATIALAAAIAAGTPVKPIAVVKGTFAIKSGSSEASSASRFYSTVTSALQRGGIEYSTLTDEQVAEGIPPGVRVVLFAYSPVWAPGEADAAVRFMQSGGKVFVFYTVPDAVAKALGLGPISYQSSQGKRAQFYEARLAKDAPSIMGLPSSFINDSWNINATEPAREDCHTLYEWYDQEGEPVGQGAVFISNTGAYMSHVLTSKDLTSKARLLLAVLGRWEPALWQQAATRAVQDAWAFDDFGSLEELEALVEKAKKNGYAASPDAALSQAQQTWAQMQQALEEKKYPQVLDLMGAQRAAAVEVYSRCQRSRAAEMRAVWIHSAFGVGDWGWEKSIRHLKEMGFNAILPNMLWGGVAFYHSDVLPEDPLVAERGDQIAQCAHWCKKYGVELHVWKVNWNLGGRAPESFLQKLRVEGRLQKDAKGREIRWLCPSDDRNFRLERDAMLEVALNYDVAGIHFDYIRYPGMQGCYCDRCRHKFEQRIGKKVENWPGDVLNGPYAQQWLQFRRDNITRLVRSVSEKVHELKPEVKVSAAVFGYWDGARDSVGQDWVKWIDEGLLDFVCPMDYIPNNASLRRLVQKQVKWVGGRIPLYVGLGEWRLRDTAHLIYQINMTRELGADGFVLFHYNHSEITDRRMPLLRLATTRQEAVPPHAGPAASWKLPAGLEGVAPNTYLAGSEVTVGVRLGKGTARGPEVELRALDGRVVRRLGKVTPGTTRDVTFKMRHEPCRLAVTSREYGGHVLFDRRSPILWSVSEEEYQELQAQNKPPVFEGQGLRVGVYVASYGGEEILKLLQATAGLQVKPLYALSPDMLAPCQVVVLPQPRRSAVLLGEVATGLADYVRRGGAVLATHDAVGYRRCPVLVADVVAGGTDRRDSRRWKLTQEVAGAGLEVGRLYEHTYYDHIILAPGPQGKVLATDERGDPLVVVGSYGKGKFCGCGMALGLGDGDRDCPLSDAEARLLQGLVKLLAP
ncbi:MAG: family 10 glycosylhydrolase [Armatimonadetes bacterium]|nr:family 10 glycosylhydrolase [Armatimonadota bacterium]